MRAFMNFNYAKHNVGSARGTTYDKGLREYMLGVFGYMSAALFITGFVAFLTAHNQALMDLLYTSGADGRIGMSALGWLVTLSPIAFVLFFSFGIHAVSTGVARFMLLAYASVMGLSLSSVFLMYTQESIANTFFITASVFAAMSIYGYTTKKDLTSFGSFLIMGLIGLLIASVVNIFLNSSAISFVTSIIGVLIFTGLTAWDVQRIANIYWSIPAGEQREKAAVIGTFSLYMDFINLFLYMLRFLGNRK
jgi:FtsH-binding integral membrane protein